MSRGTVMPNEYLTLDDVADILKVSRRTVQRKLPALKAHGLKTFKVGSCVRVVGSTLSKAIDKAATRESALV